MDARSGARVEVRVLKGYLGFDAPFLPLEPFAALAKQEQHDYV
jgi:hypothetical protein